MGIITKSKLIKIAYSKSGHSQESVILEGAGLDSSKIESHTSVFLSHSHFDSEYVKYVIALLKEMGIGVYVDWMDYSMPKVTNGKTAAQIKQKIKENDKFVFLATNKSIESKWCNWEIGLGDAHKYINKIALFPLADDNIEWRGIEYLHLYPYIKESDYTPGHYKVVFPAGNEISLTEWLNQ